jgi:hypothetical protein
MMCGVAGSGSFHHFQSVEDEGKRVFFIIDRHAKEMLLNSTATSLIALSTGNLSMLLAP